MFSVNLAYFTISLFHYSGKTLLLDEFPIESYIPQRHEKLSKKKKKKKKSATHVNTISKFLYHTLLQNNHIGAPDSNVVVSVMAVLRFTFALLSLFI